MERILHRGYNLDKRDMEVQTEKIDWYQMLQKENEKGIVQNQKLYESMEMNMKDIKRKIQSKYDGKYTKETHTKEGSPTNPYG